MENKQDRAILVGLELNNSSINTEHSLIELENLALALNIKTISKVVQKANKIMPKYYIGSGKVLELKKQIEILNIDIVIFDDPLSPAQIVNLENALDCQIIDRSFLILSIFASRAKSKQSVLEVALAQKQYMLPRLVGMGLTLSRQGGGTYNAKGPGETKLEMDRRRLLNEITAIKKELVKTSKEQDIARKKRISNDIPIVALIGYTNVGKSSIMNGLAKYLGLSEQDIVLEENMLFATLDTKTVLLKKEHQPPFLLIDTVGFVEKLPHELVRSFESTLSDVLYADLLIHVVDGAYFNPAHINTTKNVLKSIGASHIERIMVLTKKDISYTNTHIEDDYVFVSNKTLENYDELVNTIYGHIYKDRRLVNLKIPFNEGNIYNYFKEHTTILKTIYEDDGYLVRALLSPADLGKYKKYIL
ncbi:MAG TPA: GTPase HflX [Acholeplasmataceae bacterium]|nr:GTPase HflX [Acholeplasmataceae bacterium]